MAVLVLLAAAARAGVVAADFLLGADGLRYLPLLRVAVRLREHVVALFFQFGAVDAMSMMFAHVVGVL